MLAALVDLKTLQATPFANGNVSTILFVCYRRT